MLSRSPRPNPKSSGPMVYIRMWSSSSSRTWVRPVMVISSRPSSPWTTRAWRQPSGAAPRPSSRSATTPATPSTWAWAPAGLVSGPRMLKTVRMPISRRGAPAYFMAGWKDGANMKPMPTSVEAVLHLRRGQVDLHPQGLQHVGAAALAAGGPVAVLGHLEAGPGHDEGRGGGDVEGGGAVAAGPAGVHHQCRRRAPGWPCRASPGPGRRSPRSSRPSSAGRPGRPRTAPGSPGRP